MVNQTNLFHPVKFCVCFTSAADGSHSKNWTQKSLMAGAQTRCVIDIACTHSQHEIHSQHESLRIYFTFRPHSSSYQQTLTPVRTFLQSWIAPMAFSQHLAKHHRRNISRHRAMLENWGFMAEFYRVWQFTVIWKERASVPVEFWPGPRLLESSCRRVGI